MLKEKFNKLFNEEGNGKKKIENLVFFLIILVITIILINIIWKDEKKEVKNNKEDTYKKLSSEELNNDGEETLENRLEKILGNINGVGKVNVLLTYNETEELVPVYNKKDKKSSTNEVDSHGGTRCVEENDISQEVIYENNQIVTQKKVSPKVEGAIITASGANNSNIKTNIIQAVEAATRSSYT